MKKVTRVVAICSALAACLAVGAPTVGAAPVAPDSSATSSGDIGYWDQQLAQRDRSIVNRAAVGTERESVVQVYSSAMNRSVPVHIRRPKDTATPAPVLYLLDGGARYAFTDIAQYLDDAHVNIVSPAGGINAYWTDWKSPDPDVGVAKWETFMTKELPPVIDNMLGTTGRNAVAGMSRVGTSALQLAIAKPGLYDGVAAYSACANVSDPVGQALIRITMNHVGEGNPENMYGPSNDPEWAAHDPWVHAERLRGTAVFLSAGSGLPGQYDRLNDSHIGGDIAKLADQIIAGGAIEAVTNGCTRAFAVRLTALGMRPTTHFRLTGTHAWSYWNDDFHASWPMLSRSLGLS